MGSASERLRHDKRIYESLAVMDDETRELVGIADKELLKEAVSAYAEQVIRSRQIIQRAGIG